MVIEGEPSSGEHQDSTSLVRSMIGRLDQCTDLNTFFREGARQVRGLTGFDRVMVYRFAPDGSGEVVGEACKAGIGTFFGLRYPASDIPQQARELYKRNLLRVIADVDAEPVPIVPQLDPTGRPLDLSLSMLRAVSPIHIEYLRNMGVGASMSISIMVEGRLWGLFACHHYSPRCPSFERRSVCELFSQMFSMRLEARERQEHVAYERRARDISDQLLGAIASNETLLQDPEWLADILMRAIPADGMGIWIAGSYAFSGVTPPTEEFRRIIRALNGTAAGKVFATDHIGSILDGAGAFASTAAGMLAIPISRSPRDYVVLFRSELVRAVRWGGDPHKPVEYGPNGPRLTPRQSFEEWKELVQGKSQPFSPAELRVAETLRATLIEVVLRLADEATAERQQASARQEMLIAELNHRVRNILGVIRGLIRQSQPDEPAVRDFVRLVDGRIHALARAHNQITDDHWGPAPMQALIDAETAAIVGDKERLVSEGKPLLLKPQAYSTLALLLHELVTNSTKYGSLSVPDGRTRLGWHLDAKGDLQLQWSESGGPPVTPPKRKGFGTTIIERSIPYDLGGTAEITYDPAGIRASSASPRATSSNRVPARRGRAPEALRTRSSAGPAGTDPQGPDGAAGRGQPDHRARRRRHPVPAGGRERRHRGDDRGRPRRHRDRAARPRPARHQPGRPQQLPDRPPAERSRHPLFFATGYGEQAQLPMEHRSRIVVQKPYTLEIVARAVHELTGDPVPAERTGADRSVTTG